MRPTELAGGQQEQERQLAGQTSWKALVLLPWPCGEGAGQAESRGNGCQRKEGSQGSQVVMWSCEGERLWQRKGAAVAKSRGEPLRNHGRVQRRGPCPHRKEGVPAIPGSRGMENKAMQKALSRRGCGWIQTAPGAASPRQQQHPPRVQTSAEISSADRLGPARRDSLAAPGTWAVQSAAEQLCKGPLVLEGRTCPGAVVLSG